MDDKKWIREIHQGNNEPLGQIAEKYYGDIYRFCCYQTGNPADACDCAQETFIRFIRYVDSYRERNLKGYLLTIAANVCRDYFKKLYRDRELEQAQLARPDRNGILRKTAGKAACFRRFPACPAYKGRR